MKVKFYTRKGKNDERIIICLIFNREQIVKVSTNHCIPLGTWDKKDQQVDSSVTGADELNEALLKLKLEVLRQYRLLCLADVTEWQDLSEKLKSFLTTGSVQPKQKSQKVSSVSMEEAMSLFLTARSVDYKPETIRKYEGLLGVWNDFEQYRQKRIPVQKLNYGTLEEFRGYLISVRENRNDTVYKSLASLKSLIRWLIKAGHPIDRKCLELRQQVKSKNEIVTLTEDEIALIKRVRLKKEQRVIRDCFLFQLYTGQRYSDMQQLTPEQISEGGWKFQSIKTGKDIFVPMLGWGSLAYTIAQNYGFQFPKLAPQYFNRVLKKICKTAGIDDHVTLTRYNGIKAITISKAKYNLISSHTARRTCVSLLLAKGIPPTTVMKLTGHSDIHTMMRYERTTNTSLIDAFSSLM